MPLCVGVAGRICRPEAGRVGCVGLISTWESGLECNGCAVQGLRVLPMPTSGWGEVLCCALPLTYIHVTRVAKDYVTHCYGVITLEGVSQKVYFKSLLGILRPLLRSLSAAPLLFSTTCIREKLLRKLSVSTLLQRSLLCPSANETVWYTSR